MRVALPLSNAERIKRRTPPRRPCFSLASASQMACALRSPTRPHGHHINPRWPASRPCCRNSRANARFWKSSRLVDIGERAYAASVSGGSHRYSARRRQCIGPGLTPFSPDLRLVSRCAGGGCSSSSISPVAILATITAAHHVRRSLLSTRSGWHQYTPAQSWAIAGPLMVDQCHPFYHWRRYSVNLV